jgi:hypothetical protein
MCTLNVRVEALAMLTKNIPLHIIIKQLIKMLVRGPCPHDNIHIWIKQLIALLVRDPCPHDNIHQIYYTSRQVF